MKLILILTCLTSTKPSTSKVDIIVVVLFYNQAELGQREEKSPNFRVAVNQKKTFLYNTSPQYLHARVLAYYRFLWEG